METTMTVGNARRWTAGMYCLVVLLLTLVAAGSAAAQGFSSGSNGSDGALTVAVSQGTIVFDPRDTARWGRVLDADGDGVFHFTTISVGSGTTLVMSGDKINKPVHWLATGDVTITG